MTISSSTNLSPSKAPTLRSSLLERVNSGSFLKAHFQVFTLYERTIFLNLLHKKTSDSSDLDLNAGDEIIKMKCAGFLSRAKENRIWTKDELMATRRVSVEVGLPITPPVTLSAINILDSSTFVRSAHQVFTSYERAVFQGLLHKKFIDSITQEVNVGEELIKMKGNGFLVRAKKKRVWTKDDLRATRRAPVEVVHTTTPLDSSSLVTPSPIKLYDSSKLTESTLTRHVFTAYEQAIFLKILRQKTGDSKNQDVNIGHEIIKMKSAGFLARVKKNKVWTRDELKLTRRSWVDTGAPKTSTDSTSSSFASSLVLA